MFFHVVTSLPSYNRTNGFVAYLLKDNWDDWFKFETTYMLVIMDKEGNKTDVGAVKIGQLEMAEGQRSAAIPTSFEKLDKNFFSLGQDENYYEMLSGFGAAFRERVLKSLRDCAYDLKIFEKVKTEPVTVDSLMRGVSISSIRGRFNRLAHGDAKLTNYTFAYTLPSPPESSNLAKLEFSVEPESTPPTNVHVLIGRNGVGKTRCLDYLAKAILEIKSDDYGSVRQVANNDNGTFSNLVSVSFSAFDPFRPLSERQYKNGIRYAYVGLKRGNEDKNDLPLKSKNDLVDEFINSVEKCRNGLRLKRWEAALETLESDPLFKEANILDLADDFQFEDWQKRAKSLFERLSSGHGIILLTITRLVELVDEQTLVLLDEPEGHLHPPLLSAFIRALSNLLIQRNGVAIIATHSPVVLQEVPKSCVFVLNRSGTNVRADRPEIETFGENVGILTREVFGLEVIQSGFHKLIEQKLLEENGDYQGLINSFGGQLGAEGRAIARGLSLTSNSDVPNA